MDGKEGAPPASSGAPAASSGAPAAKCKPRVHGTDGVWCGGDWLSIEDVLYCTPFLSFIFFKPRTVHTILYKTLSVCMQPMQSTIWCPSAVLRAHTLVVLCYKTTSKIYETTSSTLSPHPCLGGRCAFAVREQMEQPQVHGLPQQASDRAHARQTPRRQARARGRYFLGETHLPFRSRCVDVSFADWPHNVHVLIINFCHLELDHSLLVPIIF